MIYKNTLITGVAVAALAMPVVAGVSVMNSSRALAQSTSAQSFNINNGDLPNLSAGVQEFGLGGNIDYADDIAYNLNLSYGYFFKDNWQVGFTASVQGKESDFNVGAGLFTEYNFVGQSKWVPFVGFSAKWAKLDTGTVLDTDSIALGLELGVKYFLRENLAVSFSIGSEYAFEDVFPGGDDFNKTIKIGTRFYF